MALARLALRNLHQRVLSPASFSAASVLGHGVNESTVDESRGRVGNEIVKRFSTEANEKVSGEKSENKDVAVSQGKRSRLFPRRQRRRGLWRDSDRNFVPALYDFFPSGLGNALVQATENINRLLDNLNISPWSLSGRVKEKSDSYKLQYDVPGLAKEDVKIIVHDGFLEIKGEYKEEEEEGLEGWRYGYYDTILQLPDDAKVDDIKAELKDGVLTITIPRTEKPKKDVKEVNVQ
ncbi:PREDICTED: small [Prunus dulcis]|uniref:PREDICTED: small n=1 Tax=Prunus dulcis TaxID=3755 RepID=A0A5E4FYT3_PRUDU|nr:26.5 kDa heat shock protein, mitochondrial [Prunus dulcis]VVA32647.1 PREDICTED: small [Prunus dulcis]